MKKLLRSLLVLAPSLQDARFEVEARLLRLLHRPFRPEFAGLRALKFETPLVVDIGCNRGISISTIRSMLPDARIVGYEPNTLLAATTALIFANDPRIEIRANALGAQCGDATLYVPNYRGYRFDGFASFDRVAARALFDDRLLYWLDAKRLIIDEQRVAVRRLDDEAIDPDLVKLYVQGHECAVLEGGRKTIARSEPVIIAPAHHGEVDRLLRGWGYRRYRWRIGRFEAEADGGYVVYYMTTRRVREAGIDIRHPHGLRTKAFVP